MRPTRPLLYACALAVLAALPAAAREIVIKSFDEQVVINRDATVEVIERIEAQFIGENWHGIYRTIPIEYVGSMGLNYTLFIDHVHASDNGQTLKVEQSRQGQYLKFKIYVPDADNSTHTIALQYQVLDALRFSADNDEFYWNVTGQEWDVPINSASATIELPEGVTGLHAIAYTGAFMARGQDANVKVSGNEVDILATRPLGFHEGLTAVVGFDKGAVSEPSALQGIVLFLRSNWPFIAFPVVIFVIMFWVWWTRGRDPERDAVTTQYDPPEKLTPAECGALVDNEAVMRDITATLVDLAVKGYLTIEQVDQSGLLGLTHHKDYVFHMKKPPDQWQDVRDHEREMLTALFDAGTSSEVKLSTLQNHFYTHLPAIRDGIFNALVGDGYYLHRPDTVRQGYIGGGLVIGFMIIAIGNWYAKQSGMSSVTWTIAGVLSGAIICGFGWFMPARTISGARTFAKVLGFEDFLSRVEKDRIERMENAPELFEKFLPYAMALHVEKKWVQAFSGITMQPPQWYVGPVYAGGFQPYFLVNDLNAMSTQAGTVMASSPRSAGGSGFGGGGGAGGGFGGGGGGGF